MKAVRGLFSLVLIAANILVAVAMLASAYAMHFRPDGGSSMSYWGMFFPALLLLDACFVPVWLVVRKRWVVVPLLAMLLCANAVWTTCPLNITERNPEGSIKVVTYNTLNLGNYSTGKIDENIVIQYLVHADADIVCLQEANAVANSEVKTALSSVYPYIETAASDQSVFLALLSKHPILSSERIAYGSVANQSVAFRVQVGEDTVLVVNNHLESFKLTEEDKAEYKDMVKNPKRDGLRTRFRKLMRKIKAGDELRAPQADAVAEYISQSGMKYVICCGDFNDAPLSYARHRLAKVLDDTYTRAAFGMSKSYNASGMYFRIDHILCSHEYEAFGTFVDDYSEVSDHYPVVTWLKKR